MHDMKDLRNNIDNCDRQIKELLEKRFAYCSKVGEFKKANNLPVKDQQREDAILNAIENTSVREVYKTILAESCNLQK